MSDINKRQKIRDVIFCVEMTRKRRLHPVWAKMGLIAGQPQVLFQLSQKDRITQKESLDACCTGPATLSRVLDRLEAMGYITRNDNPDCRRSFLIETMEEGKSMAEQVCQTSAKVEERMTEGFSAEGMDLMESMLRRTYENLK